MFMEQKNLKEMFVNYASGAANIFKNRDYLSDKHTPQNILHREEQIETIAKTVAPATLNQKTSNMFVYGKVGTGKTLVVRHVTAELESASKKVRALYVNCKMKRVADTEYRFLSEMSTMLGKTVPPTGLPTDEVYKIFTAAADEIGKNIIIIIDEIDSLVERTGDGILYFFTRINQDLKHSKLSIIGITNNTGFLSNLDSRVRSGLSEEEVVFPPYNANQLNNILTERANLAFNEGVLETGVIAKCAALAAQEHGDARKALNLLRISGEIAERNKSKRVILSHVDQAEEKMDIDSSVELVRSLPKQSLAVLSSIIKLEKMEKDIQTGDVFSIYENTCMQRGLKILTQRRVADLIAELDTCGIINTKIISKGRYGRTRQIRILLNKPVLEKVKAILKENHFITDSVFAGVVNKGKANPGDGII
jgi:cell division control protein 6